MQRILVVCNPRSSKYKNVRREVLDVLMNPQAVREKFGLSGVSIGRYEVAPTDVDDNAKQLSKLVRDGDLVLAVGGDATAVIGLNGVLLSEKDATLAALPYGNFNDLARTLKTVKLDDIFAGKTKKLYPLDISVNEKHFRFASCYTSIGMMAEAVEIFDNKKIRAKLRKGHRHSWRSYVQLAKWYFKNRHKKVFLPEFFLNGVPMKKKSDYFAVNGRSLAKVMKGKVKCFEPDVFLQMSGKLTSFWRLVGFMSKSILCHVPGEETIRESELKFLSPASIEIQAEGEYKKFEQVKTVKIQKNKRFIKVITRN